MSDAERANPNEGPNPSPSATGASRAAAKGEEQVRGGEPVGTGGVQKAFNWFANAKDLPEGETYGTILWWGRGDRQSSRNAVLRKALSELGWAVSDFKPPISRIGYWSARVSGPAKPTAIWVPAHRQRDVRSAAIAAKRWGVPLIFDPMISAYDKRSQDRRKHAPDSRRAMSLLKWERALFAKADLVLADTNAHADYYHYMLDVDDSKLLVVPVGAEASVFEHSPLVVKPHRPIDVLFHGNLVASQGPQVIVKAAKHCPQANWTILGTGPLREQCINLAQGMTNLRFESALSSDKLAARIAECQVCLGLFSSSDIAGRSIPYKVYQSMASGRPIVTRAGLPGSYPERLEASPGESTGLFLVPAGDAVALADQVAALADDPDALPALGDRARKSFEDHFSMGVVRDSVAEVLNHLA